MKDSVKDGKWHISQICLLHIEDFNFCKQFNTSRLLAGGTRRSARVWPSEEAQWSAARGVYNYTGFHFYTWHSDICTPQFLISFKILLTGSCHWGQGLLLLQVREICCLRTLWSILFWHHCYIEFLRWPQNIFLANIYIAEIVSATQIAKIQCIVRADI